MHTINDDCTNYDTTTSMGEGSTFQWQVAVCTVITWVLVYFCMYKGVKSSSYVVWVTVPLPIIFVFVMVCNGLTLKNSDQGIRMYIKGERLDGQPVEYLNVLANPNMWAEACA